MEILGIKRFTGRITAVSNGSFTVKRDDSKTGSGYAGGWLVYPENTYISIEMTTQQFKVTKKFTERSVELTSRHNIKIYDHN